MRNYTIICNIHGEQSIYGDGTAGCMYCDDSKSDEAKELMKARAREERIQELEQKLAAEHENFLIAHRDNMKSVERIIKLGDALFYATEVLKMYADHNQWKTVNALLYHQIPWDRARVALSTIEKVLKPEAGK